MRSIIQFQNNKFVLYKLLYLQFIEIKSSISHLIHRQIVLNFNNTHKFYLKILFSKYKNLNLEFL